MSEPTSMNRPLPASYLLVADLIHMTLAAFLLSPLVFVGTEVPFMLQLLLTGLIMVVMLRGGSWLVLGAMQVSMFFYESRVDVPGMHVQTVIQAVCCLALVAYAAGFRHIRHFLRQWLGRLLRLLLTSAPAKDQRSALTDAENRREQLEDLVEVRDRTLSLLARVGRMLAIVVVASIAFMQLPFTIPGLSAWRQRTIDMGYQLWPGPTGFIVALVCLLIISMGSWRRLNGLQATIYLRSFYVREHFRELRSILIRGGYLSRK